MKWVSKRLGDVADFHLGKMLDEQKNRGEPLPYLANVNVRWGEFDMDHLRQMRFEPDEMEQYGLKYGDIVMCEGGEPGRCAIWKETVPGMMIQKALHRIRARDGMDHRFLFYSFLHRGKIGGFASLFTGSTIKHLPRQNLAKLEINFPPLPTQHRIASILSAYDDLIENNRRRIALLEQSARLLYEEWFVRLKFPGHERTRIVNGVPVAWERMSLGDALTLHRGYDLPEEAREPGDIPVYASTGVTGFHNIPKAKGPGVVTGRSGTLGMVLYVPGDFWPLNTALFVSEFKTVSPVFALFLLRTLNLDQYNGGASVPTLDRKAAHRIDVVLPAPQLRVCFEEHAQQVLTQIQNVSRQNQKLRAARDLLLPRLMNGEITT